MEQLDRRRFLQVAAATFGAIGLGGVAACSGDDPDTGADAPAEPSGATGSPFVDAFFAAVPLVVTMRTLQTFAGLVGVNRLFTTSALADESSRFVVAPNRDTLYAIAVLDLADGPAVIELPDEADRYHVLQILDAWMGGIGLLGTRATGGVAGRWAIVGPGTDAADVPVGVDVLESPTRHAFVLGRIRATEDPADQAEAAALAKRIVMTAPDASADDLGEPVGPPQDVGTNGAAFFDEVATFLALAPPTTAATRAAMEAVADVVVPGGTPTDDHPDRVEEMDAAVSEGADALAEGASDSGELVNGWQVNRNLGRADDSLSLRDQAVIARFFWGPVPAEEAIYPRLAEADDGEPLDGSKRYRITFPGDDLPPVDGFWSLTVYGEDLFFAPNEIGRFSLSGDTPGLVRGADGSVVIGLQHEPLDDPEVNWLPVPATPFTLVMRLYLPQQAVQDGSYDYPPVEVVG